jgi:hypothetical protein
MKTSSLLGAFTLLFFTLPAAAAPQIDIRFVEPERYTDAAPNASSGSANEREVTLAPLRALLVALANKRLRDGDRLVLEVLDIDMAGESQAWRSRGRDVRVVRNAVVQRMHLRYKLTRAGVDSSREEHIADPGYIQNTRCAGRSLCYEERMLDRWFARRFGTASQSK